MIADGFLPEDELIHPFPTDINNWNESWLLSFCDESTQNSGLFRIGVLPNQKRLWLWLFFNIDGEWLAIEETGLDYSLADLTNGISYQHRDLSFSYEPTEPFEAGRFKASGVARRLTGPNAMQLVPISVDFDVAATGPCFDTGMRSTIGDFNGAPREFSVRRFEQPSAVVGDLQYGNELRKFTGLGQRDRSWGPRKWEMAFTLGELHAPDLQLWFAAGIDLFGGGIGYTVREGKLEENIDLSGSETVYDDAGRVTAVTLRIAEPDKEPLLLTLALLAEPLYFQVAHDSSPHQHFDYYRTLVRAHRSDGGAPLVGWFEANRIDLLSS